MLGGPSRKQTHVDLPVDALALAKAAFELLASSSDLAGIVERAAPHRVVYLNATALRYAAGSHEEVTGRPLTEVFARAASGPLLGVVEKAALGEAQSLRGVATRRGVYWNIDAVAEGDVILVTGRPLDTARAKQRLEMLLASTDAIWRNADMDLLASSIVRSAVELLPGTACSLSVLRNAGDDELDIVAGSEEWLCVGTGVPLAGSRSGEALATRRPVEGGAGAADQSHRAALAKAGIKRLRVVPLLPTEPLPDGRPVLGVLSFMTREDAFDEDERLLMDEFGKRASVALDRAELIRRERLKGERHRVAFDAAIALASSLSPKEVADRLLQQVVMRTYADRATLSTIDGTNVTIQATYSRDGESAQWIGQTYSIDRLEQQPLVLEALATRRPVVGGRLNVEAALPEFHSGLRAARHTATLPLLHGDEVRGILVVSRYAGPPFTDDELATLNLIGHAAMLSLHNAQLHAQAIGATNQAHVLAGSLHAATETALELIQQLELSDVTSRLLRRALEIGDADRAVLLSVDGEYAVVMRSLSRGDGTQPVEPPARVRLTSQPLLVAALESSAAQQDHAVFHEELGEQYRDEVGRLQTFASVPLKLGAEAMGILNLSRYRRERFSDEQLRALTLVGQVAALAMRNARLFEDVRSASVAKTEFLNMAAHELRSPISVLRGYLSLLVDGTLGAAPTDWKQPLDVVATKVNELNAIAEELLLAARVQSGSIGGRPVRFDLGTLVREAVDGARPAATLAGGSVVLEIATDDLAVFADPTQVRRILNNLLVNSIAYSPPPPDVTVKVGRRERSAVVSIVDRGRGIPPDKWETVFDQFVRVDHHDESFTPGTGLGLYVSRGFARANGGEVRLVRSVVGAGSEFELELPLAVP